MQVEYTSIALNMEQRQYCNCMDTDVGLSVHVESGVRDLAGGVVSAQCQDRCMYLCWRW